MVKESRQHTGRLRLWKRFKSTVAIPFNTTQLAIPTLRFAAIKLIWKIVMIIESQIPNVLLFKWEKNVFGGGSTFCSHSLNLSIRPLEISTVNSAKLIMFYRSAATVVHRQDVTKWRVTLSVHTFAHFCVFNEISDVWKCIVRFCALIPDRELSLRRYEELMLEWIRVRLLIYLKYFWQKLHNGANEFISLFQYLFAILRLLQFHR